MRRMSLMVLMILLSTFLNTTAETDDPIEYKLAVINAGGYVPKNHITVARFRSLLEQLDATFVENKTQIADMSVKTQQLLRDEGIDEKLINIMEGLNKLFPRPLTNQQYSEYSAMYLLLRQKSFSHEEAIDGLKGILEGLGAQ